jgi:quercetin dioxygenase-like cupin family protein
MGQFKTLAKTGDLLMAKPGDVIENKLVGDRIVFLQTARETNGQLLEMDCFVRPGGEGTPEHIHPHQEERFIVVTGAFTIRIDGKETTLGPGQECSVPVGILHSWRNQSDGEVHVRIELRPAGRMEGFLEAIYGLAHDDKLPPQSLSSLLQLGVVLSEFHDADIVQMVPLPVQKLLGFIGRLLGYKGNYPYPYESPGKTS